jgi:glutathione S-transferase
MAIEFYGSSDSPYCWRVLELRARFLPVAVQYPSLARWFARVESLPGYSRTRPAQLAPAARST